MNPAQIIIEVLRSLRHHFEVFQSQHRFPLFCVRIEFCKRYGGLKSILDLSTIPGRFAVLVEFFLMLSRVFVYFFSFDLECLLALYQSLQVHLPYL